MLRQHGVRDDSGFYLPELLELSESLRLRYVVAQFSQPIHLLPQFNRMKRHLLLPRSGSATAVTDCR